MIWVFVTRVAQHYEIYQMNRRVILAEWSYIFAFYTMPVLIVIANAVALCVLDSHLLSPLLIFMIFSQIFRLVSLRVIRKPILGHL